MRKNTVVSVLGVMVVVPAQGALTSVDYVSQYVSGVMKNIPVPAGSLITGYGSEPSDAYTVLVGTGTGSAGWMTYGNLAMALGSYMSGIAGSKLDWTLQSGSSVDRVLAGGYGSVPYWVTRESLASGLGSVLGSYLTYVPGSAIQSYGYETAAGGYVLGGSGSGSAGWLSYGNLAMALGSYMSGIAASKLDWNLQSGSYVDRVMVGSYGGAPYWVTRESLASSLGSVLGSYLTSVPVSALPSYGYTSSAGHVLAGTGTGSAMWMTYANLASGLSPYLGSGGGGGETAVPAGSMITGYGLTGYGNSQYALVGSTTTGAAAWVTMNELAGQIGSRLQYVNGSYVRFYSSEVSGSYVLVGQSRTGSAAWMSYENLASGLSPYLGGGGGATAVPAGSMITGYGLTGYGNSQYALVGSTTTGAAAWVTMNELAGQIGSRLQYVNGSYVWFYGSAVSGSYVLAGTGTGSAGWVEMSGLGSQIKFNETATAEELQANTGTIYFPVIQNGKVYGVTPNDFYILMNTGQ